MSGMEMASGQSQSTCPLVMGSLAGSQQCGGLRVEGTRREEGDALRLGLVKVVLVEDEGLGEQVPQQPREGRLAARRDAADANHNGALVVHGHESITDYVLSVLSSCGAETSKDSRD